MTVSPAYLELGESTRCSKQLDHHRTTLLCDCKGSTSHWAWRLPGASVTAIYARDMTRRSMRFSPAFWSRKKTNMQEYYARRSAPSLVSTSHHRYVRALHQNAPSVRSSTGVTAQLAQKSGLGCWTSCISRDAWLTPPPQGMPDA